MTAQETTTSTSEIENISPEGLNPTQQSTIKDSYQSLNQACDKFSDHQSVTHSIMGNLLEDMTAELDSLGLTEQQEQFLLDMMETKLASIDDLFEAGHAIEKSLSSTIKNLQGLI